MNYGPISFLPTLNNSNEQDQVFNCSARQKWEFGKCGWKAIIANRAWKCAHVQCVSSSVTNTGVATLSRLHLFKQEEHRRPSGRAQLHWSLETQHTNRALLPSLIAADHQSCLLAALGAIRPAVLTPSGPPQSPLHSSHYAGTSLCERQSPGRWSWYRPRNKIFQ